MPRGSPEVRLLAEFLTRTGGLGVPSVRVRDNEQLTTALASAIAEPGPHLIEAAVPGTVG